MWILSFVEGNFPFPQKSGGRKSTFPETRRYKIEAKVMLDLQLVNAVNSNKPCGSSYGHFVHDIKQGMSSMEESIFRHVDWGANSVVHVLAKEACTHVTNKTWWHSIIPCIGGIIRKEELHPLS
jgi:hypothetical protein